MSAKPPQFKRETFTVAPDQGAAALVSRIAPEGYRFCKLVRKGTKAVVTYVREGEP